LKGNGVAVQINNPALLRTVFSLKGNFTPGLKPERKSFSSGIEVAPYKNNAQAAVSISADFEMSWAWRGRGAETARHRGVTERENVPRILAQLDKYAMPTTWATVGHLFLERCERSASGHAHPGMPRPRANERWQGDWYVHDPCSNVEQDPLWYAPDLVQQILHSKTAHEIGTHTFSHINFSPRCSTAELVEQELQACADAMRPFGLSARSLVFPHNISEYAYAPLLAGAGVMSVRHRDDKVCLSYPERTTSGVYKIYESMNLRAAKHYDYLNKAKIFIQKAIERSAVYSLWFHPSDSIAVFEDQFCPILQYIESERRAGRVWVATMADLVAYCEARECLEVSVERDSNALNVFFKTTMDVSKYGTSDLSLIIPSPAAPSRAWLHLANGEQVPVIPRHMPDAASPRFMVNIPTNAKALKFVFAS
jgi:hypothetical protein